MRLVNAGGNEAIRKQQPVLRQLLFFFALNWRAKCVLAPVLPSYYFSVVNFIPDTYLYCGLLAPYTDLIYALALRAVATRPVSSL